MEYLGNTLDIHTGGEDNISPHHVNEMAQSEAATGKAFVRFWVHHRFLMVNGEKMSKSKKNFYTIDDIINKGFDPLALRYLFLTGHYRDPLNFTWESLGAAQNALNNLREEIRGFEPMIGASEGANIESDPFWQRFLEAANNDLNTPQALAVLHEMLRSDTTTSRKSLIILKMDKILGLGLEKYLGKPLEIPSDVKKLIDQREKIRKTGDFKKSDKLRHEIKKLGYEIKDTPTGPRLKKA